MLYCRVPWADSIYVAMSYAGRAVREAGPSGGRGRSG
jgi:hypothetical protein